MAVSNAGSEGFSCLIVEDDAAFADMAASVLREEGGAPAWASNLAAARQQTAARIFDLVLLDNHLPDGKGYDYFEAFSRRHPDCPVIMITGLPDLGEAVRLTRNGLFDYLTKPVSVDVLVACLRRAKLRLQRHGAAEATEWSGESPAVQGVLQQIRQAARHAGSTVLFTGETGVGKDLAARVLHQLTFPDGKAPFIAVNCAAVPADMFEAELFGAERGAYTGADRRRGGLVSAAAGGTLFLDEIAEVPLVMQSKLLRLLESREYRALGGAEMQTFTGRFVTATNKVLADEVKAGRFREDLLYRLDVFAVAVPPLRQRRADIAGLAESLLAQLATRYTRTKPWIKPEDLQHLGAYDFPGNVRELRNILERSLLKTPEESRWLALDSQRASPATPPAIAPTAEPLPPDRDLPPVEAQEYRLIRDTLRETHGGIRRAAAKLGLSPQALLRRLEKWPELRIAKE